VPPPFGTVFLHLYALLSADSFNSFRSQLKTYISQDICSWSAVCASDTLTRSFARYKFVTSLQILTYLPVMSFQKVLVLDDPRGLVIGLQVLFLFLSPRSLVTTLLQFKTAICAVTRKPCCRKETARCRKFTTSIRLAKLRKRPRFKAPNMLTHNAI